MLLFVVVTLMVICGNVRVVCQVEHTWLFGRHASLVFQSGDVLAGNWEDSSRGAPGIIHSGGIGSMMYVTQRSLSLSNNSLTQVMPFSDGNIPDYVPVRVPGRIDEYFLIQTNQSGRSAEPAQRRYLIQGALYYHRLDLRSGEFAGLDLFADTLCSPNIPMLAHGSQAAATQAIYPASDGRDLWMIVPMVKPTEVRIYKIDSKGIKWNSSITLAHSRAFSHDTMAATADVDLLSIGEVKMSPDGQRIAFATGLRGHVVVAKFDARIGLVYDPICISDSSFIVEGGTELLFNTQLIYSAYGLEFSPDGTYLYVTRMTYKGAMLPSTRTEAAYDSLTASELLQYRIDSHDSASIVSTKNVIVDSSTKNRFAGLQLGPDGRIYVAQRGHQFVSRINNPNVAGLACGFEREAVKLLDSTACGFGFPFVMASTLGPQLRAVSQDVCVGDTARIPLAGAFITDSVVWDFGDSTSPKNVGYGRTGSHFYSAPGAYFVTATMYVGSQPEKPVTAWVYVHPNPVAMASAVRDSVCPGDTVELIGSGGTGVRWFDGDSLVGTGKRIIYRPDSTTTLTVIVESAFGCLDTTSLTVRVKPAPTVSLVSDTSVCAGSITTLKAVVTGATSYSWSSNPVDPSLKTNGATATFTARTNGSYTINASGVNGCIRSKTIRVNVLPLPTVVARGDTTICRPSPVSLSATGARTYTWLDEGGGSVGIGASLTVTPQQTTKYVVVGVDSIGCTNTDTVTVTLRPDIDLTVAGDNISCDGQPITLVCSAPSGVNESDIMWLDETGATFATGKSVTVLPTRRTVYRATLPGAGECTDTVVHEIKVGTRPQFTITPTDTTVCAGDTVVVVSSTGKVITVPSQPGSSRIAITEEDSVGCATTMESWIRGITPDAITASLRDTTVDIGNGTTTLHVNIIAPQQFVGTTLGSIVLHVTHKTRSIKIDRFIDARTGATLTPSMQGNIADRSQFEVTVPTTTLTSTTEPLLNIEGLPLIDDDSTSNVDVQILSIAGLGACTDSSSKGGLLTITGCGRGYMSGLRVGSALSVKAYPNPTSDNLTVAVDVGTIGTITIDLIDALGQKVMSSTATRTTSSRSIDTHMLDMQNIPAGTYRVVVSTPVEVRTVGVVRR